MCRRVFGLQYVCQGDSMTGTCIPARAGQPHVSRSGPLVTCPPTLTQPLLHQATWVDSRTCHGPDVGAALPHFSLVCDLG